MDVFLTADAFRSLGAAAVLARTPVRGYLIGHRRGPRYYAEAVIPAPGIRAFSYTDIQSLDRIYDGRTIGLFMIGRSASAERPRLEPYACGRILIEAKRGAGPGIRIKAFVVEYNRRFVLKPVPVTRSRERRKT
jgi:hypothetical protein